MQLNHFLFEYNMYDFEVYSIMDYFYDEVFSVKIYRDGRYSILVQSRPLSDEESDELKLLIHKER